MPECMVKLSRIYCKPHGALLKKAKADFFINQTNLTIPEVVCRVNKVF